jgi:hypothetical protein
MAEQYDNNMRFAMFKNNKTKETQPDYTGNIIIDNKELRLSGWIKKSKKGVDYLSGQVSEQLNKKSGESNESPFAKMEDDIPF